MEISEWEKLSLVEIKTKVREVLGEEDYKKVSQPSITWETSNDEMTQYFDSVLEPIDTKMRSVYEESSLPIIQKKLEEIRTTHKDEIKDSEIDAFKRCLDESVHRVIINPSGSLGYAISSRMNENEEGASQYEHAFLFWYLDKGPQELRDVKGILRRVHYNATKELAPPPEGSGFMNWTPPDSKKDYVDAIKVLDLLQVD